MTADIALLSDDDVLEGHVSPGDVLEGKYKVERLLSRGGMSSVYLAEHTRIRRRVAIKLLHQTELLSPESIRRFEHEAQVAGRVDSSHIVQVLDVGTAPGGDLFLVMEHLEGETLKERLEGGPLPPAAAAGIARQLLDGLADAHQAGVVHLDLKPGNIFLVRPKRGGEETVKVLDFGIARFEAGAIAATGATAVLGTAHYMSPEQAVAADRVDARSDVYAVGVILYRAVTGRLPFSGTPTNKVLHRVVFDRPPSPCELAPGLDADFAAIVSKAMARDPEARYQTALDLAAALAAWELAQRAVRPEDSLFHVPVPAVPASAPVPVPVPESGSVPASASASASASVPARVPAPVPAPVPASASASAPASESAPAPAPAPARVPAPSIAPLAFPALSARPRPRTSLPSRALFLGASIAAGALAFAVTAAFDRPPPPSAREPAAAAARSLGRASLELAEHASLHANAESAPAPSAASPPPPKARPTGPVRPAVRHDEEWTPPRIPAPSPPPAPSSQREPVKVSRVPVVDDYGY